MMMMASQASQALGLTALGAVWREVSGPYCCFYPSPGELKRMEKALRQRVEWGVPLRSGAVNEPLSLRFGNASLEAGKAR